MPAETLASLLRLADMDTVSKVFGVKAPTVAKSGLVGHRCSFPDLVMGVELEIERLPHNQEWYQEKLQRKTWTVDTDGSLRPPGSSFEFISKPLELQYLLAELTKFFADNPLNAERNYSDRTSVHIHTNVTDFTQQQLASLALVYTVVEDVLFQYVNHYKEPTPDGYSRDTNIYCIPWNQCRMNYNLVNEIFANPVGAFRNWQKYTALNLLPITTQGTVEWRHMHGTNDMEKLTIWVNLIGSIMKFAKGADFEDVIKTVKSLNDTSAYQQFFNTVLQDYLPYEEGYQVAMSEGVINAKYALFNWDAQKGTPKKKTSVYEQFAEEVRADINVAELAERRQQHVAQMAAFQANLIRQERPRPAPRRNAPVAGRVNAAPLGPRPDPLMWDVPRADEFFINDIPEGGNE